jgi:hypothetical protein
VKDKEILLDAMGEVFRKAWYKENPYKDPEDYPMIYTTFCENRIKALLESIKDKVD